MPSAHQTKILFTTPKPLKITLLFLTSASEEQGKKNIFMHCHYETCEVAFCKKQSITIQ
jgi:hypothetical protein